MSKLHKSQLKNVIASPIDAFFIVIIIICLYLQIRVVDHTSAKVRWLI